MTLSTSKPLAHSTTKTFFANGGANCSQLKHKPVTENNYCCSRDTAVLFVVWKKKN